jgi:uncharacterized protein YjiS (DUF1127 family)
MSPTLHRIALSQGKLRVVITALAALPVRITASLERRVEDRSPHAAALSDHLLQDIGLTRSEAGHGAANRQTGDFNPKR